MSQLFNRIKVSNTSRNTFDLSHHQVTTSDFGYLIPICYRDMVPNDDFTVTPKIFTRLSPLAVPCYGRITARVHSFFVPYRILYPFWDAFISQDPNNHTIPPYFPVSTLRSALQVDPQYGGTTILPRGTYGRLMSNLGLNPDIVANAGNYPTGLDNSDRISAFPFLAYYRIWLDYFMDSSLNDHPAIEAAFNSHISNGGSMAVYSQYLETRNVCYKKDYFTTAKLNPQDGNPSLVGVDIASSGLNPSLWNSNPNGYSITKEGNTDKVFLPNQFGSSSSKIGQFTVEALRAANSLQRYLERNNFVGTKIINRILAHFGIQPTAERLDMAEFIGGNSFPIEIRDVTSYTPDSNAGNGTDGLGNQAGKGIGINRPETVHYHAKEHGIFMTVMSILPDTGYYQGLSKMWTKGVFGDALDYFTPEFENLGYQEVLNKEVYVPDAQNMQLYQSYDPDGIFGFQPRYSEYKFQNDILAGDMTGQGVPPILTPKPQMSEYYDSWHLFRKLSYDDTNPLALNNNFVELNNHNNDYDRIFQYTANDFDHFFFNIECDVKATRPMIGFAEPSLENANDGDGRSINLPYGGTRL